jgi:CO/xanthine dehydrogenase FAD-binding subunit
MVNGIRPENLQEALDALSTRAYTVMAGGTDLMVQRARGFALAPEFNKPLLFIEHLPELKKIYIENDEIHIGACAILTDIMLSEIVPAVFKEMIGQMASPPTRNMASLAGNIVNASPAGDTLPYLYAVNAKIALQNAKGARTVNMDEFIVGLKKTCLQEDELVTDIIIPNKVYERNYYRKLGQRKGMSLTKASILGMADIEDAKVNDIRIALGSVSAQIVHSADIEETLKNRSVNDLINDMSKILADYDQLIKPISDARSTATYRKAVSLRMIKDFIQSLHKK